MTFPFPHLYGATNFTKRYWRIFLRRNGPCDGNYTIAEVEFRESVGGADATGSGTAAASSDSGFGRVAANAFDNDGSTYWESNFNQHDSWLSYDFGSGTRKEIVEVAITARGATPSATPLVWYLQYSDDNTNWTTKFIVFDDTNFTASEQRVYNSTHAILPQAAYSYTGILDAADILGSDLRGWYAADLQASGQQKYWGDISGRNRNLGIKNASITPTTSVAAQNSLNVMDFDGSDDLYLLDAPFDSGDTSGSLWMVIKVDSEADQGFMKLSTDSSSDHYPFGSTIYTAAWSTARKTVGNPTPSLTSWRIIHVHSVASDWAFWIDGTSFFSTGTNTVFIPSTNTTELFIGCSSGAQRLNGQIAEIIFSNGKPSSTVREKIEGYLAHKWALTGNLDSGHPYKSSAPT